MTNIAALAPLPLEPLHQELGAKLVPFAGYHMPVQYTTGVLNEHMHTRTAAGLFDVSHMGAIKVTGDLSKATKFLESLIPSDLAEMGVNTTKYGLLLNENGGIVDDLLINRIEDGYLLVVNAGGKHNDLAYLQNSKPLGVDLIPNFDHALLALQGPLAATVLSRLESNIVKLKFMTISQFTLFGEKCFISRTGYTGEDGFELIIPPTMAPKIFNWFTTQSEVKAIGLGARDSLRLEAGLCLYGHDLDQSTTPVEAALTWALGKRRRIEGDFKGSIRVLDHLKNGAPRKRVGLRPTGKAIAREGSLIFDQESNQVGIITSGTYSPVLKEPIAMGYIDTPAINKTNLTVSIRDQHYPLSLSTLPFVPHNYFRG